MEEINFFDVRIFNFYPSMRTEKQIYDVIQGVLLFVLQHFNMISAIIRFMHEFYFMLKTSVFISSRNNDHINN